MAELSTHQRREEVDRCMKQAMTALTQASCLLGQSEGKAFVQAAHSIGEGAWETVRLIRSAGDV